MASSDNYQIGKGVLYVRPFTSLPTTWTGPKAYAAGAYTISDDRLWLTASGGTSGTGAPTGATGTFTDGTVSWAQIEWRDVGNVPSAEYVQETTTLDHYSSRSGIKTRDLQVVTERKATLNLTVDEITFENLQLATMGGTATGATGSRSFDVFASDQTMASVKFVASNDVGTQQDWFWGYVRFLPGKSIKLISDGFNEVEISGEVGADWNAKYGTVTES
jgi:hypothetical protein